MSDKSKSFKPVTRPSPAEVMKTVRDTGALDAALPTVSPAQAAQGTGEGQGAPQAALRQPPAPETPPSPPVAAPEPAPAVYRPPAPAQPPAQPAAIAKAPAVTVANANASDDDEQVQLNLRISKKLDRLLREQGRKYGSKKLALCLALQRGGLDVPAIDLENRSSRRDD